LEHKLLAEQIRDITTILHMIWSSFADVRIYIVFVFLISPLYYEQQSCYRNTAVHNAKMDLLKGEVCTNHPLTNLSFRITLFEMGINWKMLNIRRPCLLWLII